MPPSALESTIAQTLRTGRTFLRAFLLSHDRGVVLGVLLSLLPIPPLPVFGLVVCLANLALLRRGHLSPRERRTVRLGVMLSAVNTVLAVLLLTVLVHWAGALPWQRAIALPRDALSALWSGAHRASSSASSPTSSLSSSSSSSL